MSTTATTHQVRVLAAPGDRHDEILTPEALDFIGRLDAAFTHRRHAILKERLRRKDRLVSGSPLDFPIATSAVRADPHWRVAPPAPGLTDRRVEITGPPDRRMTVNALNSGARVWMADFGLYFFHCAQRQIDAGHGPYFYLPKLENAGEARLWNDIFILAQELLGIPRGTVRATVLIETITAAFEMEEILHALREHSSGLNAGRRHYLFSIIKTFGHRTDFQLPDRAQVTMTAPFMRAYAELLVRTCHKRGAHAISGMTARVPSKVPQAHAAALAEVRLDKEREAEYGFDGSRVAHPGLVPVCRQVFDGVLGDRPQQLDRTRDDVAVTAADLLAVRRISAAPTDGGVRANVAVALRYFDAWLRGHGAVALYGLMEDAATAEIARVQLWQWLRHRRIDRDGLLAVLDEECAALAAEQPESLVPEARAVLERAALERDLPSFFTPDAYSRHLVRRGGVRS